MNLCYPRDTCQYIISGTDSFRLGSRKILSSLHDTPYNNFGGNRQNIEKGMRVIWIPDRGYKFIQVDQRGAEALIVAYLCRKGNYRALFENNIKPHTFVALHVFAEQFKDYFEHKFIDEALNTKIELLSTLSFWKDLSKLIQDSDNWPGNRRYYFIAKKIVHASNYGMAAHKYSMSVLEESEGLINLPLKEAEMHLIKYHNLFPEIRQDFQQNVLIEARKFKRLYNLFGFPFEITDYISEDYVRSLISWKPQSTVATLTNIAFTEMQEYIEENHLNWHLLANTHDSYLCEAPENEVRECAERMKFFIEKEFISPIDKVKFRMRSEIVVGSNWGVYNEEKNPNGLKEYKF